MSSNPVSVVPSKPLTKVQLLAQQMMKQKTNNIKRTVDAQALQDITVSNRVAQGNEIRTAVKEGRLTIEKVNERLLGANKEALAAYNKLKPQYDAQVQAYITYAKNVKELKKEHANKMKDYKQATEKLLTQYETLLQTTTQNRDVNEKNSKQAIEALDKEHEARIKTYLENKAKLASDLKTYLDANPLPELPAKLPEPALTLPSEVSLPELSDSLVPPVPAGVLNKDEKESYFLQYKKIANDNVKGMIDNLKEAVLPSWNKFITDSGLVPAAPTYKEMLAKFEADILPVYIKDMKPYFEREIEQGKVYARYRELSAKYDAEVKSATENNRPIPPKSNELAELDKRLNRDRAVPPPRFTLNPPIPPPVNSDPVKEKQFSDAFTKAYKTNVDEKIKADLKGEEINKVNLPNRSDSKFSGGSKSYYDKYMKYKAKYIALKSNML